MEPRNKPVARGSLQKAPGMMVPATRRSPVSATTDAPWGSGNQSGTTDAGLESSRRDRLSIASDALFRAAIEGNMDNVVVLESVRDSDGEIIDFEFAELNERAAQLMRAQRSEIVGRLLSEQYPHDRNSRFFLRCKRVAESGVPEEEDHNLPRGGFGIESHRLEARSSSTVATSACTSIKKMDCVRARLDFDRWCRTVQTSRL